MPSFLSSFRNHSASGKAPPSTPSSAPSSITKTSVPLHKLCERCRKFSNECSALDWFQTPRGQAVPSWPFSRLCTVTHLSQSAPSCHFCKMVFAELQDRATRGIRPTGDEGVYACPRNGMSGINLSLELRVAKGEMRSAEDGRLFAVFKFQTFDSKFWHVTSLTVADQVE